MAAQRTFFSALALGEFWVFWCAPEFGYFSPGRYVLRVYQIGVYTEGI